MNPLNYGSLEACKRLHDAGIVVETDFYWLREVAGWRLWQHFKGVQDHYLDHKNLCIPALSMAEAWRMLPDHVIIHKYSYRTVDDFIDLLIWLEKEKKDG